MSIKRVSWFALSSLLVVTLLTSVSSAQFGKRPLRWLGQGFGTGYHQCNPGPNSDYYNPYTAHNTFLVSKSPRFGEVYGTSTRFDEIYRSGKIHQGIPFSEYASPSNGRVQFDSNPGDGTDNSGESIGDAPAPPQLDPADSNDDSSFFWNGPNQIRMSPPQPTTRSGFSQTGYSTNGTANGTPARNQPADINQPANINQPNRFNQFPHQQFPN